MNFDHAKRARRQTRKMSEQWVKVLPAIGVTSGLSSDDTDSTSGTEKEDEDENEEDEV